MWTVPQVGELRPAKRLGGPPSARCALGPLEEVTRREGGIILAAGLQGQRGDGRNRSRGARGLAAVSVGDGASGVFNGRTQSAPARARGRVAMHSTRPGRLFMHLRGSQIHTRQAHVQAETAREWLDKPAPATGLKGWLRHLVGLSRGGRRSWPSAAVSRADSVLGVAAAALHSL